MAGAIPLDRLVGQPNILNWVANQQQQSNIDRTGLYDYLMLNLSYTLTLASYTTFPTLVGSNGYEAGLNLVQSVLLQATGNAAGATTDTLTNVDLVTLGVYQYYYNKGILPGAPMNPVANAAYNGSYGVKIFFIDPWSNKSTLTRLDSRLLSSLQLTVGWRDATSIVSGGVAGTATLSNAQMVLSVREWQNIAQRLRPWLRMSYRQTQIVAQQNAFDFQGVPIGNVLRRELMQGIVPQVANYNYGWSSAAAFGSTGQAQGPMWTLQINSSTNVLSSSLAQIASGNVSLLNLQPTGWGAGTGAIPGWYLYEPAQQKKLSQALPMWGINRADDLIDVAAPGTYGSYVRVTDLEVVGATVQQLGG